MELSEIKAISGEAGITKVLLDADILSWEIGCLKEHHPFVLDAYLPLSPELLEKTVLTRIYGVMEALQCENIHCYLTGRNNFRNLVAKQVPYKGSRKDLTKPDNWQAVRDIVAKHFPTTVAEGCEADDLLAIECKRLMAEGGVPCIASRDKDLDTVGGWRFRWQCGQYQPPRIYFQTPWDATKYFYTQMLTGDNTDHIMGCGYLRKTLGKSGSKKGIGYMLKFGVRGVDKLIDGCSSERELYEMVREQYVKKFSESEADEIMLENLRLLGMGQTGLHDLFEFPVFSDDFVGVTKPGEVN